MMSGSGLLMLGGALLLSLYMILAKRSQKLPALPFGLLIAYLAVRSIYLLVGHLPLFAEYDKWIDVASSIVLAWAVIRLTFAIVIECHSDLWLGKFRQVFRNCIVQLKVATFIQNHDTDAGNRLGGFVTGVSSLYR